jgi:hypothetical protein
MRIRPLALLAVALSACSYQPTPTSDTLHGWPSIYKDLTKRTEYDLGCPLAEQTFKDLGAGTVGVSGCGKKATYKYVENVGWVMDSASGGAPGEPAA